MAALQRDHEVRRRFSKDKVDGRNSLLIYVLHLVVFSTLSNDIAWRNKAAVNLLHNSIIVQTDVNNTRANFWETFKPQRDDTCITILRNLFSHAEREKNLERLNFMNLFTINPIFLCSACSFIKVIWSTVSPSLSTAFTLAPWSSNSSTMTEYPSFAAKWSADWFSAVGVLTSHPGC